VPAVKPQSACYELYGWRGVEALERTIRYAGEKGLYVIADVKRNDIGSTAEAYAGAYLGEAEVEEARFPVFNADSVTVNGYLGTDGIEPFLKRCRENDKSVFVLVKTSNKSSGELQDQKIGERAVYEVMAENGRPLGGRHARTGGIQQRGRRGGGHLSRAAESSEEADEARLFSGAGLRGAGGLGRRRGRLFQ
jgi:orotidine-5'-phosphate decarboxylase